METIQNTDIVIIGAGPVGLFAVFECGMLGMKCHVVDSLEHIGGQLNALYPEKPIYDIPGMPEVMAQDLVAKLEEQAGPFAPVYHLNQQVTGIDGAAGAFTVTTSTGTAIACKAIIVAAGAGAFGPNRPPLAGLADYEGTSVFYMVRNRSDFAGRKIAIAGGGDSAVDWALSLAPDAAKTYFIHRRDKFRAAPDSVAKLHALAQAGKVDMVIPYQLHALHGANGQLSGVEVADFDDKTRLLDADILLPFFGLTPQLGPIETFGIDTDRHHVIVTQDTMETTRAGIFAVGDIAAYPRKLKLILTGFAEAAQAAHTAHPLVFPGQALHFVYSTTKGVP